MIVSRRVAAENLLQFKHVARAKEANIHLPALRPGIFIGAAGPTHEQVSRASVCRSHKIRKGFSGGSDG